MWTPLGRDLIHLPHQHTEEWLTLNRSSIDIWANGTLHHNKQHGFYMMTALENEALCSGITMTVLRWWPFLQRCGIQRRTHLYYLLFKTSKQMKISYNKQQLTSWSWSTNNRKVSKKVTWGKKTKENHVGYLIIVSVYFYLFKSDNFPLLKRIGCGLI